jgi:nucleotide exchange factor SIL1
MYFVSVISSYSQLTNLALHKDAYQSSVYKGANASLAVDGSRQTNFFQSSCTHTNGYTYDNKPWWYVDLGSAYFIWAVTLTNRDVYGSYIKVVLQS